MRKRVIQISGFLISSLGWLFVLCTMAMDYWRITKLGGQGGSYIIKVAWYWSNLWSDCYTDSAAVTNCREYPVLWNVAYYVQAVRGLLMCGLTIGFFAVVCCFVGMECTYIGGSDKTKDKVLFAGAVLHFVGGNLQLEMILVNFILLVSFVNNICLYMSRWMCSMIAYSYYGNKIRAEFEDPNYMEQKFEIGVGVFIGWGGSTLLIVGGLIYSIFAGREGCHSR
uniref:Claudin n=1 Tax=Astatotilapia calliptera TaxID=8154 RepID=A0A3P8P2C2_ASTCA